MSQQFKALHFSFGMHATVLRRVSNVASAVSKLLPQKLPPILSRYKDPTLLQLLSQTPRNLKGTVVHQKRWSRTGKVDWFWKVTAARFKCDGKHGKVWGTFYLNGRKISQKPELIRHALKYSWAEGRSKSIATSRPPARTSKPKGKTDSVPESKVETNSRAGT